MNYYIKDNYYFDIDYLNQLRITGPQNHLLLGLSFPRDMDISIDSYDVQNNQLVIKLSLPVKSILLALPLVTDIRTLRSLVESVSPKPTYEQLILQGTTHILPRKRDQLNTDDGTTLFFLNEYSDNNGMLHQYGSELHFEKNCLVSLEDTSFSIISSETISFTIRTVSTLVVERKIKTSLFKNDHDILHAKLGSTITDLYVQSQQHIEHLILANKTSSFEYGTIFPRDWIESADLGKGDLTQETLDYMYSQSMSNVSETGEGWHEDIVGEYKLKFTNSDDHIDRKMIDIEPHYILGVSTVSKEFLLTEDHHQKLKKVAHYIIQNAKNCEYITFKKATNTESYFQVGNWRDSLLAFPSQKSPLAPYDVNCVFYPMSLRLIRQYHDYFEVADIDELTSLIEKWDRQKAKFRLYHHNDLIGYSLALHGKKNHPLPVAHLDESYDLFYGIPSLQEIASFAAKIQADDFFYTPVGPMLVASDEDSLTTKEYHGKVIWPKQVAFSVGGLTKQYQRGLNEMWPWPLMQEIKQAIIKTSEAFFRGISELGGIPELYYYDVEQQRARYYTDQENFEGQMSLIQLWSAVGARRIVHDYVLVTNNL